MLENEFRMGEISKDLKIQIFILMDSFNNIELNKNKNLKIVVVLPHTEVIKVANGAILLHGISQDNKKATGLCPFPHQVTCYTRLHGTRSKE